MGFLLLRNFVEKKKSSWFDRLDSLDPYRIFRNRCETILAVPSSESSDHGQLWWKELKVESALAFSLSRSQRTTNCPFSDYQGM